ncbi:MAG: hypothetical protein GKR77_03900 [Legionellales bacterium]|nr:hypothetical protein [Legionellales bacterium]
MAHRVIPLVILLIAPGLSRRLVAAAWHLFVCVTCMSSVGFKIFYSMVWLLIIAALLALSVWQWQRAQFKQQLLTEQQQLSQRAPVDLATMATPDLSTFLPVKTHGIYLNDQHLLLANQHYKGRLGYEVITPLQREHDIVLVIRGWAASKPNTRSIPTVLPVLGETTAQGMVYWPPTKGLRLRQAIEENKHWPRIISRVDIAQIQTWFDRPIQPYLVRLTEADPHRLIQAWIPVQTSPHRHLGYALQWFGLAIVAMIAAIVIYRKRGSV